MHLDQSEIVLFYKIWYELTWGINEKHKIIPRFEKPVYGRRVSIPIKEMVKVRNAIWDNPQWIDEFLAEHAPKHLSQEEMEIVAQWRKFVIKDKFIVIKHLKKYSVFIPMDAAHKRLYAVTGISDAIKDSLPGEAPVIIDTALIPFRNKIIYDSLVVGFNSYLGKGIKNMLDEVYTDTYNKYGITEVLNGDQQLTDEPKGCNAKKTSIRKKQTEPKQLGRAHDISAKYNEIAEIITKFCDEKLDAEYKKINLLALETLCREHQEKMQKGRANTWACGIVYAIGSMNFIFDRSQPMHMTATEIAQWFGLSKSTAGNKSTEVTQCLDLYYTNFKFSLKRLLDESPAVWILNLDGYLIDIRAMPLDIQKKALKQGLIPYIPE